MKYLVRLILVIIVVGACILLFDFKRSSVIKEVCPSITSEVKQNNSYQHLDKYYQMNLKLDTDKNMLSGNIIITIENTSDDVLKEICLRDYGEAYSQASEIKNVHIVNNDELLAIDTKEDQSVVYVTLKNALNIGETIQLQLDYQTTIPIEGGRFGVNHHQDGKVYNLTLCYPMVAMYGNGKWNETYVELDAGETHYQGVVDYEVDIEVPDDYLVVASGNETREGNFVHIEANQVREMAIVASNVMDVVSTTTKEDINVNLYYLKGIELSKEDFLHSGVSSIEMFNEKIGPYIYDEIDIVQTPFIGGAAGMEYPGLVLIVSMRDKVIVHEIAHQWFYAMVGSNPYVEPWLDEGITSYITDMLYFGRQEKYNMEFYTDDDYLVLNQLFTPDKNQIPYHLGPNFLLDLKNAMGEDNFDLVLKTYYEQFVLKEATTMDFVNIVLDIDDSRKVEKVINQYLAICD